MLRSLTRSRGGFYGVFEKGGYPGILIFGLGQPACLSSGVFMVVARFLVGTPPKLLSAFHGVFEPPVLACFGLPAGASSFLIFKILPDFQNLGVKFLPGDPKASEHAVANYKNL